MHGPDAELADLVARVRGRDRATPATPADLAVFTERMRAAGVPAPVTAELHALYTLDDGLTDDELLGFHPCADPVLLEWWDAGELWLGQRHLHTLRWTGRHGYAIGAAADVSFGPDHEFGSVAALLRHALASRP